MSEGERGGEGAMTRRSATSSSPVFGMVAGEPSGDLLAGLLLDGLRARWSEVATAGIGGPQMLARGFQSWWPMDKLAVRGYIEVLRHYAEIAGIRRQLKARLLREWPQLFIGVDAPDFNLDLEAGLRGRGIRTVHFVCPSIWAWRPERIEKILELYAEDAIWEGVGAYYEGQFGQAVGKDAIATGSVSMGCRRTTTERLRGTSGDTLSAGWRSASAVTPSTSAGTRPPS